MKLVFKKMDAFAKNGSAGNPAGAIYLERGQIPAAETMQKIALELSGFVSEIGFVFPLEPALSGAEGPAIALKYYSPEREVDFCGHATISILYDLFKSGFFGKRESVLISTNRGILAVQNRIAEADAVYIMAPLPEYGETVISRDETAKALGIESEDIGASVHLRIINAGLNTLLVPITSLEVILAMKPDFDVLKAWCLASGADIVEVFCRETVSKDSAWRVRVFCPRMGYLEDPATGSGNSALGYYLLKNRLWDGNPIILEQNGERELFNIVKLTAENPAGDVVRVHFGGGAQVKIDGHYHLA